MGVLLQAFYWDCPAAESSEGRWLRKIMARLPDLAADGFTALWLPPSSKAAKWNSMGYDPYDYFDLGEFNQKGRTETWFGTRQDLLDFISAAHQNSLQVYADVVLNHNSGGDGQELNPIDGKTRWTQFAPKSGRFPRDWTCFHPSSYETMDGFQSFGDMPDLCHRNPDVYKALMEYTHWLIEDIGFDGFRFDFVKGYGPWMVKGIAEYRYSRGGKLLRPFCIGECWDSDRVVDEWLGSINNAFMDNPVSAFDFPLHYKLKNLCDQYGFDLRGLASGTVVERFPLQAATFVDNHDTIRDGNNAVVNDKLLAYAFILTSEGYPSVFWQDYFNFNLAGRGTPNGIAALISAHEGYAGGTTSVLYADSDLYVTQRGGFGNQPGLIFVLNNRGDVWNGKSVTTQWQARRMKPIAWWGRGDRSMPAEKRTDLNGVADFWAAPRGYAIYAPA
jgi:alpha-amylase